ncbi:MAG: VanZ family protein [Myxococcota bacterium]
MTRRALWRLPVGLIYLGGILWLCSTPARDLARLGLSASTLDLVHIPLFAGLTWVTLWVLGGPARLRIPVALAACLVLAAVAEWLQAAVPGRVASLADLRANAVGVLIGIVVFEAPLAGARRREQP